MNYILELTACLNIALLSTFKYSQTSSLPVDSVAPKLSLLQKHVYSILAVNIVT